jgi:hypothetical protein
MINKMRALTNEFAANLCWKAKNATKRIVPIASKKPEIKHTV